MSSGTTARQSAMTRIFGLATIGVAAAVTLPAPAASGAVILPQTPQIGQDTMPTDTLGAQGYVLYGVAIPATNGESPTVSSSVVSSGTTSAPVSYVQATVAGNTGVFGYSGNVSTDLIVNGTDYKTGQLYTGTNPGLGIPTTLISLTLTQTGVNGSTTTGAPVADFTLGVLEDNWGDPSSNDMASITVSLSSGTSGTADTATLSQLVAGNNPVSNDFYLYTISGAHVGDTIDVSPASNKDGGNITIGGLTFDAAVPEPTSMCALLALGALTTLQRKRRCRIY